MAKTTSGAIISYGTSLPSGMFADGSLFCVTEGVDAGIYAFTFNQDSTTGTAGDQVGFGWRLISTTQATDATTLDGYDSTDFQFRDVDLTALADLTTTGFISRTGSGAAQTRTFTAGSSKVTITNGDGISGNPTIDVAEANLVLSNLSGTLGVAHGGTGVTSISTGGVLYGATSTTVGSVVGASGQVLISNGASAPTWANQSTLSVGSATTANSANSATTATTATTALAAPWSGITGKPTTVAGFGITDAATTTYVDTSDFLNFDPLAGSMTENTPPVYSTFPFGKSMWGSNSLMTVDNTGKQVTYFHNRTTIGVQSCYRAYRFDTSSPLVYDNEAISATFLLPGERVEGITNVGTYFVVLAAKTGTTVKVYIANTFGSSNWRDWTLLADVTSISTSPDNFSVVQTSSGARILRVSHASGVVTLQVYNTSLSLLRSLTLFNQTSDVCPTDQTASGRTSGSGSSLGLSYFFNTTTRSWVPAFTWRPSDQSFHQRYSAYYTYQTSGGATIGQGLSVSIGWNIPKTWFDTGAGTPTNLITVKPSGFRYNKFSDSTWDTTYGGLASGHSGSSGIVYSLTTDEFNDVIYHGLHGSFEASSNGTYKSWTVADPTVGNNLSSLGMNTVFTTPDSSPWSKSFYGSISSIVGNNILVPAQSLKYSSNTYSPVAVTFSTTTFSTAANPNDTLILDPVNWRMEALSGAPSNILSRLSSFYMVSAEVSGSALNYVIDTSNTIYTISLSSNLRQYTSTGVVIPAIPSTIGSVSNVSINGAVFWNGSVGSPVFWAVCRGGVGYIYIATGNTSGWTTIAGPFGTAEIDAGNSSRGDTTYNWIQSYSGMYSSTNGKLLIPFTYSVPGSLAYKFIEYNISGSTATAYDWAARVIRSSGSALGSGYTSTSPGGGGFNFGYSDVFGFYKMVTSSTGDSLIFLSSKDPRGVGANLSYASWFSSTTNGLNYETFVATESSVGLNAYLVSYPLFLGGYLSTIQDTTVALTPNSTTYVYASRGVDRSTIDIVTSEIEQQNSFNKVKLAKIVTNSTAIVSQENYSVRTHDPLESLSNVSISSKNTGDALIWTGAAWSNSPVITSVETTGGSNAIDGSVYAGQRKLFDYGMSVNSAVSLPANYTFSGTVLAARAQIGYSAGNGNIQLSGGDGTYTGYIEFYASNGVRQGYIGHATTGGAIVYASETAGSHVFFGQITSDGDVTAFSDSRLKTNIKTIENPIQKVLGLRGVTYNKLDTNEASIGVVAQETYKVLPEVVRSNENGYLSVAYGNIVGLLIEAIKEQQTQLDAQQAQIDEIMKRLSSQP